MAAEVFERKQRVYNKFESYRKKKEREIHVPCMKIVTTVPVLIHKLRDGLINLRAGERVLNTVREEVYEVIEDIHVRN